MSKARRGCAAAIGAFVGTCLLVFAGVLSRTSSSWYEVAGDAWESADARELREVTNSLKAATTVGTNRINVVSGAGFSQGNPIEIDTGANKEAANIVTISNTNVFDLDAGLTKPHAVGAHVEQRSAFAATTLASDVADNATSIFVVSNPLNALVAGSDITIDAGVNIEAARVTAVTPGTLAADPVELTLKYSLSKNHTAGAMVSVEDQSMFEQMKKQSSSGPLGSLKVSDSSGKFSDASNSKSLEVGSLKDNLVGTEFAASSGTELFQYLIQFLITLGVAVTYKQQVVDAVGFLPEQGRQYESHDDFRYRLFDCFRDCHMCCFVMLFAPIRMAHTNHVTYVCGYWQTLFSMLCCPCVSCCLTVYWRMHLKDHMGIEDHCCRDVFVTMCCSPCAIGQQAIAVDHAMGIEYSCPCQVRRDASIGDMEMQGLVGPMMR